MKKYIIWFWIVIGAIVLVAVAYSAGQSSNNSTSSNTPPPVSTTASEPQPQVTPQTQETKQQALLNQKQCSEDGSTYNLTFWHSTDNGNTTGNSYQWDAPEYHYSSKLNTCLVYERYIQFATYNTAISYQYDQVIDVYSNKVILYGYFTRDSSNFPNPPKETVGDNYINGVPNFTSDGFYQQKNVLFSE